MGLIEFKTKLNRKLEKDTFNMIKKRLFLCEFINYTNRLTKYF
jgi:hypothetical protein